MLAAWVGAKKVGGWEKDRMFSKREEVYEARGKKGKKGEVPPRSTEGDGVAESGHETRIMRPPFRII